MMFSPVLTAQEMARIEKLSLQAGCSEEAFIQEAGRQIAQIVWEILEKLSLPKKVALLVGKGNNGADALSSGIFLLKLGAQVRAVSPYSTNGELRKQFLGAGGVIDAAFSSFAADGLILDGFLGTGFTGEVDEVMGVTIRQANLSGKYIVAIDIPSGLNGTTGEVKSSAICAHETIALGCLKSGFFLREGWNCIGRLRLVDFGLPRRYLESAQSFALIPSAQDLAMLLPPIQRNRHKYQAGYVVGFSGSKQFRGSPKLAGLAALRTGCGIVRIFHREDIGEIPYSLIAEKWKKKRWDAEIQRASAVFIGSGIGGTKAFLTWLKKECKQCKVPMVVDAEAIQPEIVYPKNTILTPHRGEALRLLGLLQDTLEEDLLARCQKWVMHHDCILILKGAPTWIFIKDRPPVIIPQGSPAMAKAGTGDVLTGMIAALLAQKMKPIHAAMLGVFLHGLAGEKASREKTEYGVIAEDLIADLPHAIMESLHRMVRFKPVDKV